MRRINQHPVWRGAALCLLSTMALMMVALLNGYPLFFNDTRSYVRQPALIIKAFTKKDLLQDWPGSVEAPSSQSAPSQKSNADAEVKNNGITANRSVYYGFLALIGDLAGNFWLTVLVQSAWTAVSIYVLVQLSSNSVEFVYACSMMAVCILSCAGFYTGYIMPDIFAPLMIISASSFLLFHKSMSPSQTAFMAVTLIFSLLAHPSHQVILFALVLLYVVWTRLANINDLPLKTPLYILGGCLLVGLLGQYAFNKSIEIYSGQKPLVIPHIEAHLVDLGPGTEYAKHACDPEQFAVCRYKDRFPMFWETFIGNPDPDKGVFAVADAATKRRLSDEQLRFALAVFQYDPVGTVKGLVHDAVAQIFRFSLSDFEVDRLAMENFTARFPASIAQHIAKSAVHDAPDAISAVSNLYAVMVTIAAVSIGIFLVFYLRYMGRNQADRDALRLVCLLVTGVVVNGLVCGLLASPFDRFQARVVWLVIFSAAFLAAHFISARRGLVGHIDVASSTAAE